jgi:hypothetical protein
MNFEKATYEQKFLMIVIAGIVRIYYYSKTSYSNLRFESGNFPEK